MTQQDSAELFCSMWCCLRPLMQPHAARCSAGAGTPKIGSLTCWRLFGSLGSLLCSLSFSGAIFPLHIPSSKITSLCGIWIPRKQKWKLQSSLKPRPDVTHIFAMEGCQGKERAAKVQEEKTASSRICSTLLGRRACVVGGKQLPCTTCGKVHFHCQLDWI